MAFLLLPLYTRFLTPDDYGLLSITATLTMVFSMVAGLSLDASIAVLYFKLDSMSFRNLLLNVTVGLIVFPVLVLGILELFGSRGSLNFFPNAAWDPYLRSAVWIGYFSIFPNLLLGLLRAQRKANWFAFVSVLMFVLQTILISYFVILRGQGAYGSLLGQLVSGIVFAIVSIGVLLHSCRPLVSAISGRSDLRLAVSISIGYFPHILSMWALNVSDRWVLGYSVSPADLGIYSLAYTIGMLVHLGGISLISAFSPVYFSDSKDELFRKRLKTFINGYILLHSASTLAVSLFATDILRVMTRPQFYAAAEYVPIIAFGYWFFVSIYQLCLTVLENEKKPYLTLFITVPAAVVNIVLNIYFVPKYGIVSAAVSTLVAFALMALLSLAISRKFDKLDFDWFAILLYILIGCPVVIISNYFFVFDSILGSLTIRMLVLILTIGIFAAISGFKPKELLIFFSRSRPSPAA